MCKWIRICSFFLCIAFILFIGYKPVRVSATAAGAIVAGFGGTTVALPGGLVIIVIILLVMGLGGSTFQETIGIAEQWYVDSPDLRNWVDTASGTGISEGAVIYVPPEVQAFLQQKANENNKNLPDKIPYVLMPNSFYGLDGLTQADVFGEDVIGALRDGNAISTNISNTLNKLANSIGNFPRIISQTLGYMSESITSSLQALPNTLISEMNNIKNELTEWVGNVNATTANLLRNIKEWSANINANLVQFGSSTVDWLKNVNANLVTYAQKVIDNYNTKWNTQIESSTQVFDDALVDVGTAEGSLEGDTEEGKKRIPLWIGRARDVVSSNSTAFLAVGSILTKFFNIPIISDLLTFSLALGIFALIVNLANNLNKKNGNSAKSKAVAGKGG